MNILELILVLFFGFLIINQLFTYFYQHLKSNTIIEGIENVSDNAVKSPHTYDEYIGLQNTDPLFLAIKNAANISFLKSQIDDIANVRQEIDRLNNEVEINNTQIQTIQQSLTGDLSSPDEDNEDNEDNQENLTGQTEFGMTVTEETITEEF